MGVWIRINMDTEVRKQPIYMYKCVGECKRYIYTEDTFLRCCNKLTSWVAGIEGVGIDMGEKTVKIKVSGFVLISEGNLERLLAYSDQHMGILYALHMSYCDASGLEFEPEES